MLRLDTRKLVPSNATIAAVLGKPIPKLTFKISVDFEPIEYGDDDLEVEMITAAWEFLEIPGVRDWRELAGNRITAGAEEGSFLFNTFFSPIDKAEIRIGARDGTRFPIDVKAVVDFLGMSKEDANPALRLAFRADATFEGLTVEGTIKPPPKTLSAAKKLVAAHFAPASLDDPKKPGSFWFPPVASEVKPIVAKPPAPKPAPKPQPAAIKLAKGITLVKVPAPPHVWLPKVELEVKLGEYDSARATRVPGLALLTRRTERGGSFRSTLFIVEGTNTREVKGLSRDFAWGIFGDWAKDAALIMDENEILRLAFSDGELARVWSPPKADGLLITNKPFSIARGGDGRVVAFTRARVVVLEERGGKIEKVVEHELGGVREAFASHDGKFVLVGAESGFTLLGIHGAEARELASFQSDLFFKIIDGRIGTEKKGARVLEGIEALHARAFGL